MKAIFRICLILCALVTFGETMAQGVFAVPCAEGQTIFYRPVGNVVGGEPRAVVTHPMAEWPYYADSQKPKGAITLPQYVEDEGVRYRVEGVGANAFYRCDSIDTVRLACYEYVGTQAFCGCIALQHIELNECLLAIGEGAFAYCGSLHNLLLPDSMVVIGISAFAACFGLEQMQMTEKAWQKCNSLTFYGCPLVENGKKPVKTADAHLIWKTEMPCW